MKLYIVIAAVMKYVVFHCGRRFFGEVCIVSPKYE